MVTKLKCKFSFSFKFILLISAFIFNTPLTFAQWTWQNPIPQGNDILDIQCVSQDVGYAAGKHGTILKSTSGGNDWFSLTFPQRMDINRIQFINQLIGWVTGKKDSIVYLYKTIDGGINWAEQIAYEGDLISTFFLDDNLGWFSLDSILFNSTDGGNTWTQQIILDRITDIFFIDSTNGWLACKESIIYYTTDGANTWQSSQINLSNKSRIQFIDSSVGWVMCNNTGPNWYSGQVHKTSDGGRTWQQQLVFQGSGYYHTVTDMDFISTTSGWAITVGGHIFRTTDGGRIFNTTNGGVTFVNTELVDNGNPENFILSQNYPNPFNPTTKIKFSIPSITLRQAQSDAFVTLKIYDVLGKEVSTLINEEKPAGNYEVEFDGTGLSSGIYFYRLSVRASTRQAGQAGSIRQFVETKKMVMIK
jgi:photosystem II stability/assembly factor-like uncharacterized protein